MALSRPDLSWTCRWTTRVDSGQHAARDVTKDPGQQCRETDEKESGKRRWYCGTERFFGNIALLPFTSDFLYTVPLISADILLTEPCIKGTELVVNAVAYGVKGVRQTKAVDEGNAAIDIVASYDESELPQSDSPRINETHQRPSMMQDYGIINRTTGLRRQSNLNASDFSTEPNTENRSKELPSSVKTSRIQARDEEYAEAICRRHLDRGFRSPRLKCPDFRKLVIDKYQS
ncbi:hypothetical protein BDV33DRAFT_197439 [Aspergillus novoparasiticus]|uniref:Uncharacterized protein n=1 Tax=Aspergillus novoparasiticus TaxID=986946 RepID=A0A5N6FC96_9EURO|nr:hypothetical protein BDV33DRAFT_197439 [Aspergillus novoparasiticus]